MTTQDDKELELIYPPEKSMSGRNATYLFCDARQQQVGYAVCLHTIKKIEDHTIPKDIAVECQRAYCGNYCPAIPMRDKEVEAGQALFYEERRREICEPQTAKRPVTDGAVSSGKYDMNNPSYARGWAIGGREGYSTDKPTPRNKPTRNVGPIKKSGFVEASMADVLNVMVEEEKTKPKQVEQEEPKAADPNRPMPGESTADFIKRRALQSKAK